MRYLLIILLLGACATGADEVLTEEEQFSEDCFEVPPLLSHIVVNHIYELTLEEGDCEPFGYETDCGDFEEEMTYHLEDCYVSIDSTEGCRFSVYADYFNVVKGVCVWGAVRVTT